MKNLIWKIKYSLNKMKSKGTIWIVYFIITCIVICLTYSGYLFVTGLLHDRDNKYLVKVDNQAELYIQNGEYEEAIELYKEALGKIIYKKDTRIKISNLKNDYRNKLESEATEYINSNDYIKALERYNKLSEYFGDEKYNTFIANTTDEYARQIISDAETDLKEGDNESALEVLKNSRDVIGKNELINSEISRVESLSTFLLSSYPTVNDYNSDEIDVHLSDAEVTAGYMGYTFYTDSNENVATTEYYLNGDYDGFTASIHLDEMSDDIIGDAGIHLSIFGDDEEVFSSDIYTETQKSEDIELNGLEKYTRLSFVVSMQNTGEENYYNNGIIFIIWHPVLKKKYYELGVETEEKVDENYIYDLVINYDENDTSNDLSDNISTFETRYYHFKVHLDGDEGAQLSYVVDQIDSDYETRENLGYVNSGDDLWISIDWECPESYMEYGNAFPESIRIYRDDTGREIGELKCTLHR